MKIYPYDNYQRHYVRTRGDNVPSVIDKMIRVAAKVTENYASDIVLWCNKLRDTIEAHEPMDCVLNFREDGVDLYEREKLEVRETRDTILSGGIQQWELTVNWDGEVPVTEFQRVRIGD